jgi:hypothetical protein
MGRSSVRRVGRWLCLGWVDMLKGNEGPSLKCQGCGVVVWPRVGGYWFLLLAERGRCRFPGARGAEAVLCSGCGRRLREIIEAQGIACGEAYERRRQGRCAVVPASG